MYKWTQITAKAPFAPRDGAGALVFDGRMWLLGGWNPGDKQHFPKTCTNDVWSSTDGADWTLEKPNSFGTKNFDPNTDWEGRHTAGYAVHDGEMWIVGGDPIQGYYQCDVWNSKNGVEWHRAARDSQTPWAPRALHYTVVFQNEIWLMGGQTLPQFAPAEEHVCDDIWKSPDGLRWNRVIPEGPHWSPRGMIGGSAVFQDRIWILGGGLYDTPAAPQRVFRSDIWSSADGVHWECRLERADWTPRQYHDVAVFDDRLWILEGWNETNRNDVWHSADGVHWEELPDTPWAPRHAASLFAYDDGLWIVAGNNMESDVWKLTRQ